MKVAYHILTHLLGLGCIAACIAIVATMGALDIHWSGWLAVAFFGMLALGILIGQFPWRGKPLRVLLKGFYVMSAMALLGFGFTRDDPMRVELWMVAVALGGAIVLRVVILIVLRIVRGGKREALAAPKPAPVRKTSDGEFDPLF